MSTKRRARKTETGVRREQLAEAALRLLARRGPGGLNMVALARAVGLVPSGFYRHFRSKEAVLDAVLEFIRVRLLANTDALAVADGPALPRLQRLARLHVELVLRNEAIPKVLLSDGIFGGSPARRRRLYALLSDYLEGIARTIRQGQEAGELRSDVPAATLAVHLLGLLQPAVILTHASGGRFDLEGHVERAWPLFCAAVANVNRSPP